MDENQIARRAEQLPDRFADRVGDELTILRSLAQAGEWAELIDDLIGTLAARGALISPDERKELEVLLDAMRLPTTPLDDVLVDSRS